MDWVHDSIPLIFMGYSMGTYMAYECMKYLQNVRNFKCAHLISLAGIAPEQLKEMPQIQDAEGSSNEERMRHSMIATHGKVPPKLFGAKSFAVVADAMVEGELCFSYRVYSCINSSFFADVF